MKVYCDSSTKEACYIIDGQLTVFVPYDHQVTNNEGEYLAVIFALTDAIRRKKVGGIELLTDSQLVVNQVCGLWKCNHKHLLLLRDKVRELMRETGSNGASVQLEWIPREDNKAGFLLP